jgi:hypothetical protein
MGRPGEGARTGPAKDREFRRKRGGGDKADERGSVLAETDSSGDIAGDINTYDPRSGRGQVNTAIAVRTIMAASSMRGGSGSLSST